MTIAFHQRFRNTKARYYISLIIKKGYSMKKLSLLAIVLICNYASADAEKKDDSVEIKLVGSIHADKAVAPDVLKEALKDAKALTKKYEEVCGVKVSVEQSKGEVSEEQTRRCRCRCRCSNCTSGNCSSCSNCTCCRSVETDVCPDCGQSTAENAEVRCPCGRPRPRTAEEN